MMQDGMMKKKMNGSQMEGAPEMMGDKEFTTLNSKKYPELKGIQVGQTINGTWSGVVKEVNGDEVKIGYDEISLETENSADKAMSDLTGKKQVVSEGSEEDEY